MKSIAHTASLRARSLEPDEHARALADLGRSRARFGDAPCDIRSVVLEELEREAKVGLGSLSDAAMLEIDVPVDWLALFDVVSRVERRLGVEVGEDALARVRTIGDLVTCVADATPARR